MLTKCLGLDDKIRMCSCNTKKGNISIYFQLHVMLLLVKNHASKHIHEKGEYSTKGHLKKINNVHVSLFHILIRY